MKNAFLRSKKAKIEKSEESGPKLFFDFTYKYVPSSHNLGVMWRGNQKRKSGGNFFSLDLPREAFKKKNFIFSDIVQISLYPYPP